MDAKVEVLWQALQKKWYLRLVLNDGELCQESPGQGTAQKRLGVLSTVVGLQNRVKYARFIREVVEDT